MNKIFLWGYKIRFLILLAFILFFFQGLFLLIGSSDIRTFLTIGLYIFSAYLFKFNSKISFFICLFLLVVMYIEYLLHGSTVMAEKTSVWLVLFLFIGIIQSWNE